MGQGPTGGKKDIIAPTATEFQPQNKATNSKKQRVEITFNEYIQVNNANQNIVVSPPQKSQPITKGIGKKVVMEFRDSLQPNTTYTIDFGQAIGDYTENNITKQFTYTFSTGETLDSLKITGRVLHADDLTPCPEIYVGIHSNHDDSSFVKRPFERIAKTDKQGKFTILGAGNKQYRIFALKDLNNNYYYDQSGEMLAFEEVVTPIPSIETYIQSDTIFGDSATIDTIIQKSMFRYLPDDILLRAFTLPTQIQEFKKLKRERNYFTLNFEKIEKSLPEVSLIGNDKKDWYIAEPSSTTDTIKYWIIDSAIYSLDSLQLSLKYLITDSAEKLVPQSDTLWANLTTKQIADETKKLESRRRLAERLAKRGQKAKRDNLLKLSFNPTTIEIYDSVYLEWERPIKEIDGSKFHFYIKEDSILTPIKGDIKYSNDPFHPRRYTFVGDFNTDTFYEVVIDSAAARDYYGNHNNRIELLFRIKPIEDYATLTLTPQNVEGAAFVELLNKNDEVVRRKKIENNSVKIIHIKPGEYFLRLIEDKNGNGTWDVGNYAERCQPEKVYYMPKKLKFRKNWDIEEEWDIKATPLYEQRSSELISKIRDNKKR